MAKIVNKTKVITGPKTRWSYANVWEPKSINGGTPKYSVSLIIPKSDTKTVAKIGAAIESTYREGEAKLKGNRKSVPVLSVLKTPLRDGDLERPDDPAYAGNYFVNANATSAPSIVDATAILFSLVPRFTLESTVVPASAFILSTALAIKVSPVDLTICRRFVMASILVVRHLLNLTLQLMTTMIFLTNGGNKP